MVTDNNEHVMPVARISSKPCLARSSALGGTHKDLMPPIQLSERKNEIGVDFEWQTIPRTRGDFISVMGGKSDGNDSSEAIFWTFRELPDVGFDLLDY